MFVVVVKARCKPDKVALYEATFKKLQKTVKEKEPGVLFYELSRDPKTGPNQYVLVEAYKDQATQDEHLKMSYYQAELPTIIDCLEGGSYEMNVYETI